MSVTIALLISRISELPYNLVVRVISHFTGIVSTRRVPDDFNNIGEYFITMVRRASIMHSLYKGRSLEYIYKEKFLQDGDEHEMNEFFRGLFSGLDLLDIYDCFSIHNMADWNSQAHEFRRSLPMMMQVDFFGKAFTRDRLLKKYKDLI